MIIMWCCLLNFIYDKTILAYITKPFPNCMMFGNIVVGENLYNFVANQSLYLCTSAKRSISLNENLICKGSYRYLKFSFHYSL